MSCGHTPPSCYIELSSLRRGMPPMQHRVLISLFLASIVFAPVRWSLPAESAPTVKSKLLQAPAGRLPVKIDLRGMTVLPNGRLLTPFGKQVKVAPHPYG